MRFLFLAVLVSACSLEADSVGGDADSPLPAADMGLGADAMAPPAGEDAGFEFGVGADAGTRDDGGPDELNDEAGLYLGAGRGFEGDSTRGAATCFDQLENDAELDASDGVDCSDSDCQGLRSCCVGSVECTTTAELRFDTDFDCVDDAFCNGDFVAFGAPTPAFDEGSLALLGDDRFDSGWLGQSEYNLADERVTVRVQFRAERCDACIETAAVGFTPQFSLGSEDHVTPLVSLRAALALSEVQLVVGNRVRASAPLFPNGGEWTLTLTPDGRAIASSGTRTLETPFMPAPAVLVLYGKSANPGVEPAGARLDSIRVESASVDVPTSWESARETSLDGTRVSALALPGGDLVLVATDTDVQFFALSPGGVPNVLDWELGEEWGATDHGAALTESGELVIYAVRDGLLVETRSPLPTFTESFVFGAPAAALDPAFVGWESIAEPTMAFVQGARVLVARVGNTLRAAIEAGGAWRVSNNAIAEGLTHPSLTIHDELYWLHASEYRGTRARIRGLISDQLVFFRDLGYVLEGSGQDAFDRFGTHAPSVVVRNDAMRMYYLGDDHRRRTLGFRQRRAPSGVSR
ncbi:MAG: hypothetical protein AAF411_15655 [Myxococcota bacterium]